MPFKNKTQKTISLRDQSIISGVFNPLQKLKTFSLIVNEKDRLQKKCKSVFLKNTAIGNPKYKDRDLHSIYIDIPL